MGGGCWEAIENAGEESEPRLRLGGHETKRGRDVEIPLRSQGLTGEGRLSRSEMPWAPRFGER
jgi:hypothetical protein